jgi:hypothetical protein
MRILRLSHLLGRHYVSRAIFGRMCTLLEQMRSLLKSVATDALNYVAKELCGASA